ncbi:MAG: TonB-dependent receptor [Megasphaera sp.]|jgi:vitamin B12 transporter|nr:TonB-dependent receptor [Megasphaera sp.]
MIYYSSPKLISLLVGLSLAGSLSVCADTTTFESTEDEEKVVYTYDTPQPVQAAKPQQPAPQPITAAPAKLPVAANTAVVTAKDIETNNYTSVQEALQHVNGVTVSEQVPGTTSFIRLNGDDRVAILIDGQNIANAQSQPFGRGTVDLNSLPGVSAVDHIEVTKGSGSVKYGSGAVGGVINIITKKGDKNSTTVDLNTGSWGTHNYTLTNQGHSGQTSWYVTGSLNHRNYYKFADGYTTDTSRGDYNNNSLTARVDQKLSDSTSLTINAFHKTYNGHSSTFGDTVDGKYNLTQNKTVQRLNNNYSVTWHFDEDKDIPGFIRYYNDYSQNFWTYHFHTRTQGVQAEKGWHSGIHSITAGAEWSEDTGTNKEAGYVDKERTNRAAYVEDAMNWGKLTVTPGIRFDDNSQFGVHKTPRIAINYKANDKFSAYANWSRVFNAPRLNDLYYYMATRKKVSKGNPDLRPETGYTQSVGFNYQYDHKTLFNVNLFRSSLSDAIRWYRSATYSEVENLNKEQKHGIEISMNKTINPSWDYELGYSYIHSKVDNGTGMEYDKENNQPNGYRAGLHYHHKAWKANLLMTAGTGRNDTYYTNNSYITWDASVSYDVNKDTTIYALCNNLANEGYDLYHQYPAAGRYWQAGVRYTF